MEDVYILMSLHGDYYSYVGVAYDKEGILDHMQSDHLARCAVMPLRESIYKALVSSDEELLENLLSSLKITDVSILDFYEITSTVKKLGTYKP